MAVTTSHVNLQHLIACAANTLGKTQRDAGLGCLESASSPQGCALGSTSLSPTSRTRPSAIACKTQTLCKAPKFAGCDAKRGVTCRAQVWHAISDGVCHSQLITHQLRGGCIPPAWVRPLSQVPATEQHQQAGMQQRAGRTAAALCSMDRPESPAA